MTNMRVLWLVVLIVSGSSAFLASPVAAVSPRLSSQALPQFELKVAATDATSVRLQWLPQPGASEYELFRNSMSVGRTVGLLGFFSDFGLRPNQTYQYRVIGYNATGAALTESTVATATTTRSTSIRTRYTVLAIAFNPDGADLSTEQVYLKHRIQFLKLASLGSAEIELYTGNIINTSVMPRAAAGSNTVDYPELVTRRDLPELSGVSIVDLVERGDIDHVLVVKAPVNFFWENVLVGNRPIQGAGLATPNSWYPTPVKSSRSFFVNAYLPDERSYDAYGHMVEGVMTSISDGYPELWPRNMSYQVYTHDRASSALTSASLNLWERFRLTDGWNGAGAVQYASPGNSNVGSAHFPPNSPRSCADYCYNDLGTWQRYADSTADDWLSFPRFSNVGRKINGYEYGAFNNYIEGQPSYGAALADSPATHASFKTAAASYHQWWFAHLPRNPGVAEGKLNNWWPYILDFNRFDGSAIDYQVDGFPVVQTRFHHQGREYGTNEKSAGLWGYWHSGNGFSPGGKAATLSIVKRGGNQPYVRAGGRALKVVIENAQYWEGLGAGRNDLFYPISRNAHWNMPNLAEIRFSIKLDQHAELVAGTNPIVRLYKHNGTRIEFIPRANGLYTNLFSNQALRDGKGWYNFSIPITGNSTWEKQVIGYIDPTLSARDKQAARAQLERAILADLNAVEISFRSTTTERDAPYDVVVYYIDGLQLVER